MKKRLRNREGYRSFLLALLGSGIYAVGINLFIVPQDLYSGGLLGLCQLIRTLVLMALHLPMGSFDFSGLLYFAVNVPLFVLAWRAMGKEYSGKTLLFSVIYSAMLSLVPIPATPIITEPFTACLLGGVISGIGNGLVLTCGYNGGGLDILSIYLIHKKKKVTVGTLALIVDGALYVACGFLFSVSTMFYSMIATVFHCAAMDRMHRQSIGVQVLIFTKADPPELNKFIMENLHRGITRWSGEGVYTGEQTQILCVCIAKSEINELEKKLKEIDPEAFFVMQEGVHLSNHFERRVA